MKRWIVYSTALCVAMAAAVVGVLTTRTQNAPVGGTHAQENPPKINAASSEPDGMFFPTEQLSIVKDITAAIANMGAVLHADGIASAPAVRQVPRGEGMLARFEVVPQGRGPIHVDITDHIWAPAAYLPAAVEAAGTGPSCVDSPPAILDVLLEPSRDVIQRENARVSARLRENMRCADAHAEAALLIGSLALREAASVFNDPRRLMSRMSAHLAMTDALGLPPGNITRRVAGIVLYTLVGRQRTALDALDALEATGVSSPVSSWIRALRTRNTLDWRIVHDLNHASLLEQLQVIRAADASLGERTLEFIDAIRRPADVPDWGRLIMQGNPSVEAGNRFADAAVALELREAAEARKAYAPAVVLDSPEALVAELKVEPVDGPVGRDGSVWVIDWPMWAAIAERHLMNTINARDTHVGYSLALPDQAKDFRERVAQRFSGLRLYPFLAIMLAPTREEARPAMAASVAVLRAHPELVTHWMWKSVLMKETWAGLPAPIPRLESWFTPAFPSGTVFDVNTRPWAANLTAQFTPEGIAPYRQAAPYARQLAYVSLGPDYEKAPAAALKREFAEMAAFNLSFAVRIAKALKEDPEAYLGAMEQVVRLGPEHLRDVAEYYVQQNRLAEARRTYERWFAIAGNELAIAGSAEWMVRDYFERGEFVKANAVANRAADTGSGSGLLTRARLYDWIGNPRAAEQYYRRAYERYDAPGYLLGFLLRQHRSGEEVDTLTWKVFPGGITRLSLPTLKDPPTSGVEVTGVEKLGERCNVHVHDIVVAVDGIRVQNLAQYYSAKTNSLDPVMHLVIWRDLKYSEVSGPLRYGGLWGDVTNYVPGARPPAPKPRRW
jgi:tetratricopeptide (TPR) repeat protein